MESFLAEWPGVEASSATLTHGFDSLLIQRSEQRANFRGYR